MSEPLPQVIVHKDVFTLTTTLMSAGLNLVVVALVCFLLVPQVDQATIRADEHLAELRVSAESNRRLMERNQEILEGNRKEVERVRTGIARLLELLERLERRAKDK